MSTAADGARTTIVRMEHGMLKSNCSSYWAAIWSLVICCAPQLRRQLESCLYYKISWLNWNIVVEACGTDGYVKKTGAYPVRTHVAEQHLAMVVPVCLIISLMYALRDQERLLTWKRQLWYSLSGSSRLSTYSACWVFFVMPFRHPAAPLTWQWWLLKLLAIVGSSCCF